VISLIWAMDQNRLIGQNNRLPWRLPEDLKYFKAVTMGAPVIMGRKTFESINCRPLPGRNNIIMTRDQAYQAEGVTIMHEIADVMAHVQGDKEAFVIGGAEIYTSFLPFADRLYITQIEDSFEGDAYFPEVNMDEWVLSSKEKGPKDEKNPYHYYFEVYDRKL